MGRSESPNVQPIAPGFDWSRLRFPGEIELRREIEAEPALRLATLRFAEPDRRPVGLRSGGVLANECVCPALFRVGDLVRQILRCEAPLELFLFPSGEWFVDWIPSDDDATIRVAASSAAVERLRAREALFAIGRAIGGAMLGQWPLFADPTAGVVRRDRDILLQRGLWKFQEMSRDRVGLLCCQHLGSATRCLLKALTGLPDNLLLADVAGLLARPFHEESAMVDDSTEEFFRLRLSALRHFAASSRYAQALESSATESSASEPLPTASESRSEDRPSEPAKTVIATRPAAPAEPEEEDLDFSFLADEPVEYDGSSAPTTRAEAPEFGDALLHFTAHAAFWMLGSEIALQAPAVRQCMARIFPESLLESAGRAYQSLGGSAFEQICLEVAPTIAKADAEARLGILDQLVRLATAERVISMAENDRLGAIARLLEIAPQEVGELVAEHVEPEYADYHFQQGQMVEVQLDGEWMAGKVLAVEPSGDLRVHFAAENAVLRLSPTADLIRPMVSARAG